MFAAYKKLKWLTKVITKNLLVLGKNPKLRKWENRFRHAFTPVICVTYMLIVTG